MDVRKESTGHHRPDYQKETAQPLFANDDQCPDFTFINKDKYEATECMPLESDVSLKYYAHSPELIVFKYSFYIYEGGAHGYGASRYLTFMRKDAQVVSLKHLFGNHTDALLKIVNKEIKQAAAKTARSTTRHRASTNGPLRRRALRSFSTKDLSAAWPKEL